MTNKLRRRWTLLRLGRWYAGLMRVGVGLAGLAMMIGSVGLAGCHSAFVDAVVRNDTGATVSPVEVDYPSASFGTQTLGAGQEYHYRFKVQGTGRLKVLWTDGKHVEQHGDGPELHEGEEGSLGVTITAAGVQWDAKVKAR